MCPPIKKHVHWSKMIPQKHVRVAVTTSPYLSNLSIPVKKTVGLFADISTPFMNRGRE
jgi:hypothetical protein